MRGLAETQKKKTKKQTASKAAAETCIHLADNYHTQLAKTSHRHLPNTSQTFVRTESHTTRKDISQTFGIAKIREELNVNWFFTHSV